MIVRALCLGFAAAISSCGPSTSSPAQRAAPESSQSAGECEDVAVTVTASDIKQAGSAMLGASSPAGNELLNDAWANSQSSAFRRSRPELSGRSLREAGEEIMTLSDRCFSGDCSVLPAADPALVFACHHDGCNSKAAVLTTRRGEIIGMATNVFNTSRSAQLRAEAGGAPGDRSWHDLILFNRRSPEATDQSRRMFGAWYLLERDFLTHDGILLLPDVERARSLPSSWRRTLDVRQCYLQ